MTLIRPGSIVTRRCGTLILILALVLVHFSVAGGALARVAAQRVHALGVPGTVMPLEKALIKIRTGLNPIP